MQKNIFLNPNLLHFFYMFLKPFNYSKFINFALCYFFCDCYYSFTADALPQSQFFCSHPQLAFSSILVDNGTTITTPPFFCILTAQESERKCKYLILNPLTRYAASLISLCAFSRAWTYPAFTV